MEHTKGGWEANDTTVFSAQKNDKGLRYSVAECGDDFTGRAGFVPDEIERELNTRIIAAAPDLLEACEEMMKNFTTMSGERTIPIDDMDGDYSIEPKDVEKMSQAINKAKGK